MPLKDEKKFIHMSYIYIYCTYVYVWLYLYWVWCAHHVASSWVLMVNYILLQQWLNLLWNVLALTWVPQEPGIPCNAKLVNPVVSWCNNSRACCRAHIRNSREILFPFFFFIFKFWFYFYCAPKLILIQKAEIRFVFFSFVFTFAVYFQASQQGSYIEEKDRNS